MREYIFTSHEREVLKRYIETGTREKQFRTLMSRIRRSAPRIREDMDLIERLLA